MVLIENIACLCNFILNVIGLGFITESERRLQARKIRAAKVLKRFEGMKEEFIEWKISAEFQCDQ